VTLFARAQLEDEPRGLPSDLLGVKCPPPGELEIEYVRWLPLRLWCVPAEDGPDPDDAVLVQADVAGQGRQEDRLAGLVEDLELGAALETCGSAGDQVR